MTALRFFLSITLDRPDLLKPLFRVEQPRKLPTVLTQDEVARLLDAAAGAKYKAAASSLRNAARSYRRSCAGEAD
jgi:hypothetical protein